MSQAIRLSSLARQWILGVGLEEAGQTPHCVVPAMPVAAIEYAKRDFPRFADNTTGIGRNHGYSPDGAAPW